MKILVIGNELIAQRLSDALSPDAIEVQGPVEDLSLAMDWLQSRRYDLVIVDSLSDNLHQICNQVTDLDTTPVSLILNDKLDDWKTLSSLRVDGFLSKDASDTELRTRIKATCRRGNLVQPRV